MSNRLIAESGIRNINNLRKDTLKPKFIFIKI